MTGQTKDGFHYQGANYWLDATNKRKLPFGNPLFDLSRLDTKLKLFPYSTGCARGYTATFSVCDRQLVLASLDVSLANRLSPDEIGQLFINGVAPTLKDRFDTNYFYEGINLPLDFSGGVLLFRPNQSKREPKKKKKRQRARELNCKSNALRELERMLGYRKFKREYCPWFIPGMYIELQFENGRLIDDRDLTQELQDIRQTIWEACKSEEYDDREYVDKVCELLDLTLDASYERIQY